MQLNRKVVAIAAAVTVVAAGGVGIAYAVGGDSEEQVTGPSADKAKRAALKATGGGTVSEVERQDGDGRGAYEVEVERPDGSTVEVYVDDRFEAAGSASDDDRGSEDEGNEDEGRDE